VPATTAARWLAEQDVPAMLAAMHELPVHAGQVVFVPAGTPHAIGAGILLVELQEPTDLSVLLEWQRFGVSSGVEHLRLGWERALTALDVSATALAPLVGDRPGTGPGKAGEPAAAPQPVHDLLPEGAAPYFRAQRIAVSGEPVHAEPSFAILVVLDGWLTVWSDRGERLELTRGATALVAHAAGDTTFEGHARVIRCLPPAPDAGAGPW
jgi:mannose-6-phosphate isomerase